MDTQGKLDWLILAGSMGLWVFIAFHRLSLGKKSFSPTPLVLKIWSGQGFIMGML
jgi:hypothetical protein